MPRIDADVKGRKAVNSGQELLRAIQKYERAKRWERCVKMLKMLRIAQDCRALFRNAQDY